MRFRRPTRGALLLTGALTFAFSVSFPHGRAFADPPAPPKDATMARPDDQMRAVLEQLAVLGPKPIETLTPTEARRQPTASDAILQLAQSRGLVAPDKLPPVGHVETRVISGPDGSPLRLRVYTPEGNGPFPVVVYLHGGGWVLGTLDTYDSSCRSISALTASVVVSVDYRKAPEHPFPAAPEDSYAAFQYVVDHANLFHGDPRHVAIAGESAGGNLATVVSLMALERKGHLPVHQVLIYPVVNNVDTRSYRQQANAKPLNAAMMHWFFKYYFKNPGDGANLFASPLRASEARLRGMPPATIITAEFDPLHDEGVEYVEKLKRAGVPVREKYYTGVTHEFFGMGLFVDKAKDAEAFVAQGLREAFSR